MRSSVATILDDMRRTRGIAIVRHHGNRRSVTTYAQLAHLAGRFAAYLEQHSVQPGDRVLLWATNSAEWIAAFYGCILRGAIAVPLDAYGTADFANRICADTRPSLLLGDAPLLAQIPAACQRLTFDDLAQLPANEAPAIPGLTHDTPLQILFTSGTTGDPKGIVHTHGNILASVAPIEQGAQPYLRYERLIHPLRFLHTLPLSHVFGQMMGLWVPPIFSAEVHFEDRLAPPRLIDTIHRERISVLAAVPRVFTSLKTHLELTDPTLTAQIDSAKGISALKRWWRFRRIHRAFGLKFWAFVSGGGALPAPVEQFFSALGFLVVQGYGMTETTALITLNHPFHVKRGTIGKPLPGRETKITPEGELLVRGPMISTATWANGALHQRPDAWLPTGDLVEAQPTGELRFLGRSSEVIVTASGVNIHPEDLEAVLEQQPGVRACAVVALQTPNGPEPCAVLATLDPTHAPEAIRRANTQLAEPQRLTRWAVWPEPDLPRTSTGKVRRRAVADWLSRTQSPSTATPDTTDWLLHLISQLTGEPVTNPADTARLTEDLHLDSLARVQLAAALEDRTGIPTTTPAFDTIQTLGDLRHWLTREASPSLQPAATIQQLPSQTQTPNFLYPHWPWSLPIRWLRALFTELILRPLVSLLANPAIRHTARRFAAPLPTTPMLLVSNHVTAFDVPLLLYALPGYIRRHLAIAMAGEMLDDYRHLRNPENRTRPNRLYPPGPLVYLLLTALFNVFPLPRRHAFQRSFAHAGEALDRGLHVLIFPEGTRTLDGTTGNFRSGIGLLVKQSGAPVLPLAIVGSLQAKDRGLFAWLRPKGLQVVVGEPLHFTADDSEAAITARLLQAVLGLLATCNPNPVRQ